jgi:chromosome segregation ATPase
MPEELAAWGVPAIAVALLSTGTTLAVQWLSRNVHRSEAGKNDAEAELMGAQTAAAVMSMSREMLAELRGEVERQKAQYEEELRLLRAAVAALEAEQEAQRQQYQGRIDALEAKIAVLQAELKRERELRQQLEAEHEAGEES